MDGVADSGRGGLADNGRHLLHMQQDSLSSYSAYQYTNYLTTKLKC